MLGGKGFFCAALLLVSTGALAQSADDIRDGKVCATCHADAVQIWGGKHGTKADSRTPIAIVGCATCHGDPSEHLKSYSNPMPHRFSKMAATEKNDVCQSCHQGRERMHWSGSTHERNDVSCSSCHKLHTAHDRVRDKLTQPEVCFACHKVQRAEINRPSRHPIREGLVSCSDCHNPHGSVGRAMVLRDSVNDTCYSCHMEKRGPFVRTHQPVQEDCANCHNPHGTTAPNLLKMRQPMLCQQCHEPTSHRGNVASLTGTSTGANTLGRGCLNCHTNIHGSNNPADLSNERTFRR
jgi:DmsE family decaheme c-type cytochrome